jgi:hypothetical protein
VKFAKTVVLICVLFFLLSFVNIYSEELGNETHYSLRLSSIGFPTVEKVRAAWGINDLKIFNGRLYIGHGDAVVNTGPTDVISYDFKSKTFIHEFVVDDEAIYKYQVIDGKLVIPGPDATEEWELGNIYVLTPEGWVKKRTVTQGIHVNQLSSFKNKWYVATGNYFEFGEDELFAFGGILSSEDQGNSWKLDFASPADGMSVFRIGSLISYKDRMYVFPYAFIGMKKEDIPTEYHPFLSDLYQERYLIFTADPLGPTDVIVFDGQRWEFVDFIPYPDVCMISPFVFKEKLILSLIVGEYLDYLSLKKGLPGNGKTFLVSFDGEALEKIPFEYDMIRDIVVKKEKLFLLIQLGSRYRIAETTDLETWKYYSIPSVLSKPLSLEYKEPHFYIGTEDGNIFKTVEAVKNVNPLEEDVHYPLKFFGAAELPRDGKWYWASITGWERWGKRARFSCEFRKKNLISIETENISAMSIFIPFSEVDREKPLEMKINGEMVFKEKVEDFTELKCIKGEALQWRIEKDYGTSEMFYFEKKLLGETEIDLSEGESFPLIGEFVADVLKWVCSCDAAVVPVSGVRKGLSKGEVYLEDVYDLYVHDNIYTFTVKGADLYKMMNFNIAQDERRRCQISGFEFSYRVGDEQNENSIVESSIDPAKEYTVATTEYLVHRMDSFLGDEVHCRKKDISVYDALITWFEEGGRVTSIEPRIRSVQ